MIERYQENDYRWPDQYRLWFRIEQAALEILAEDGIIPPDDWATLEPALVGVDVATARLRAAELEAKTGHDFVAFLDALAEQLPPSGRWLHWGMTSSDVVDTATAYSVHRLLIVLGIDGARLFAELAGWREQHRGVAMLGRTHGQAAVPLALSWKIAGWMEELHFGLERLRRERERMKMGKIGGAVGTHRIIDRAQEARILVKMGMVPDHYSTQILSRDRFAGVLTALAILAGTYERIAVTIRTLSRTEIGEWQERKPEGSVGSSAMPHKRNPITAEKITGIARLLRADAMASLENMAPWDERDLAHSSVERFILPRALGLMGHATLQLAALFERSTPDAERMLANLEDVGWQVNSDILLAEAVRAGADRNSTYAILQSTPATEIPELPPLTRAQVMAFLPEGYHATDEI